MFSTNTANSINSLFPAYTTDSTKTPARTCITPMCHCCKTKGVPSVCFGFCMDATQRFPRTAGICRRYFSDIKECRANQWPGGKKITLSNDQCKIPNNIFWVLHLLYFSFVPIFSVYPGTRRTNSKRGFRAGWATTLPPPESAESKLIHKLIAFYLDYIL